VTGVQTCALPIYPTCNTLVRTVTTVQCVSLICSALQVGEKFVAAEQLPANSPAP
jgi:hypothetical protein